MANTEFPDSLSPKASFKSYVSEDEKLQASKFLSSKLHQDQVLRQQKASSRQLRFQRKVQEEQELVALREQENKRHAHQLQLERLEALHNQAISRKEKITSKALDDQRAAQVIANQRYAHDTLETDFFKRVLQPETERMRKVLVEKKLAHKSPSVEELRTHAKKYDDLMRENQRRAEEGLKQLRLNFRLSEVSQPPASQFARNVLEEDKEMKRKREQDVEGRRVRKMKQERYAVLVKEMFAPATTHRHSIQPSPTIKQVIASTTRLPLPKWKSNSPESVKKPDLKVEKKQEKDYLGEMRKLRESMPLIPSYSVDWKEDLREELKPEEKLRRVKDKAEKLDKKMRRTEACLNLVSPTSPGVLEATQHINALLLSSVRAKLSLINH